jgi:uncharacterized secreted repeat protein (TIGR03808 family)
LQREFTTSGGCNGVLRTGGYDHGMTLHHPTRRRVLAGLAALAVAAPAAARAQVTAPSTGWAVLGTDLGLVPYFGDEGVEEVDQSALLQAAVDHAAAGGRPLVLASGRYIASKVVLPHTITITALSGGVEINAASAGPVFTAEGASDIVLENLGFQGNLQAAPGSGEPLLAFTGCERLRLDGLRLRSGHGSGIVLESCSGWVSDVEVSGVANAGIFARDSHDLVIRGCRIARCGNGGILVWGDGMRHDGTIVTGNHIRDTDWRDGGNGQNGNGINVFKANGVIVSDNVISGSAFTAIRLNATSDTQVSGNYCLNSGEVAIFSEFGFAGSVIADNIIEGAAQGISMTNFDSGGRLATCTGNIVRNIYPSSAVNPDTTPAGIFAEADAVIANNVVEAVPGLGIGAGWGPYLRDVVVSGNVVRDCDIGIGVSVAEGAGKAVVIGNRVSGARSGGISALAWQETVSDDLVRDAQRFPNLSISGNSVG